MILISYRYLYWGVNGNEHTKIKVLRKRKMKNVYTQIEYYIDLVGVKSIRSLSTCCALVDIFLLSLLGF